MDSPTCATCRGLGPRPRFAADPEGEVTPLPFEACRECGLEWPTSQPICILIPSPFSFSFAMCNIQVAVHA